MKRIPARIPTVTIYDMGTHEGFDGDDPLAAAPKLIDPFTAIQWVAAGTFNEPSSPRDWYSCLESNLMIEGSTGEGRRELAEEIIVGAISAGFLRCAFVTESTGVKNDWDSHAWARLSVVDPRLLADARFVSHEWESEGLEIIASKDEDYEDSVSFSGFWLFWDEVQKLRPAPRGGAGEARQEEQSIATAALPTISPVTMLPSRLPETHEHRLSAPGVMIHGRGKGRPAGKNGEPITMFVLRAQTEGVEQLNNLADDALGAMLKEEYLRLGLNPPENTNAARDARGVMRALVKMQAKSEAQAAE